MIFCFRILLLCFYGHVVIGQSAFSRCHLFYPKKSCFALHVPLKTGLLSEYRNIYELQQAFYPIGEFATDRLINILYTVEFTEIYDNDYEVDEIPVCDGVRDRDAANFSSSSVSQFLTGWSSSGVFNIITPLQLTRIQLQLFNDVFNLFIIPGSGIFLPDRFGWVIRDMQQREVDLENVNLVDINISVNNVSCIPDQQLIKSVLQDLTAMLKVWASTEGLIPEEINEGMLGYVTDAGFDIDGVASLVEFTQFFAVLITAMCCLLGVSSMATLGIVFHDIYKYLATDRKQFNFYFFALSFSSFCYNLAILVIDIIKMPEWCKTSHYSEIGCDETIITKVIYFFLAIIISLIAACLSSRNYEILSLKNKRLRDEHKRLIYIMCSWFLILSAGLVAWSIFPTVLQIFVYPNVILSITFVMVATIFGFTVLFAILALFFQFVQRKTSCLNIYLYSSPFVVFLVVILIFGLTTVCYLNAIVFGTYIGGIIGILAAVVPSILLTVLTEYYRDWFLTRTTAAKDSTNEDKHQDIESNNSKELDDVLQSERSGSIQEERSTTTNVHCKKLVFDSDQFKTKPVIMRLHSTGEPPGYLKKKLMQRLSLDF